MLIGLEKITKPSLKINSQIDCVQIQEIEDHCYTSLEWATKHKLLQKQGINEA